MFTQFYEEASKKIINLLFVALILFVGSLVVAKVLDIKEKMQNPAFGRTIYVTGKGTVYAKPDLAIANFSVITEAGTVAEALNQNTGKMNGVISAIKSLGVEDKDLKTTVFNIYPRYEWTDKEDYFGGERVLAGYEITQSIEVKIRNLEKAGEIIQKAADAGANESGNLQFTVENLDALKSQARKEAIQNSKDKAKELAKQLGVRLGRITYFDEPGSYYYDNYYATDRAMGGSGELSQPQIQPGENKIEINVSITYEIH